MAPAGTPSFIVEKLHGEVVKALSNPYLQKKFDAMGMVVIGSSPAEFSSIIATEIPFRAKFVEETGLKLE